MAVTQWLVWQKKLKIFLILFRYSDMQADFFLKQKMKPTVVEVVDRERVVSKVWQFIEVFWRFWS